MRWPPAAYALIGLLADHNSCALRGPVCAHGARRTGLAAGRHQVKVHTAGAMTAPQPAAAEFAHSPDYVQSLHRGLAVIKVFDSAHASLTLSEVAVRAGFSRAVARRLLMTLEYLGYAVRQERKFSLTPRILDYVRTSGEGSELWLLDLKSKQTTPLTHDGAVNVEPRWSPDGRRIVFVSGAYYRHLHLFVAEVHAGQLGEPQRLTGETKKFRCRATTTAPSITRSKSHVDARRAVHRVHLQSRAHSRHGRLLAHAGAARRGGGLSCATR